MIRRFTHAALSVLLLAGFLTPAYAAPQNAPSCPLSAAERQLVEEIVRKAVTDSVWVADNTHGAERGFALSLVGTDHGYVGFVFRIAVCTGPESFEPYCENDTESSFVRCLRLACEGAGVDTAEVSISHGQNTSTQATRGLAYRSEALGGTVIYRPNPSVIWRAVRVGSTAFNISADLFRNVTFQAPGKRGIDLTHTGSVSVMTLDREITSLALHLTFPALVGGRALTVDLAGDAEGTSTGTVRLGPETIATISGHGEPVISWSSECAS